MTQVNLLICVALEVSQGNFFLQQRSFEKKRQFIYKNLIPSLRSFLSIILAAEDQRKSKQITPACGVDNKLNQSNAMLTCRGY